jgi:hypothetical protein
VHCNALVSELRNVGAVPFSVHSDIQLGHVWLGFCAHFHERVVIQEDVMSVERSLMGSIVIYRWEDERATFNNN